MSRSSYPRSLVLGMSERMHDLLQLRAADSRTSMQALVTTMLCKELNLDLEETFTPKQAARRAALHAAVSDIAPSAHKGTTPNPRKLSPLLQAAAASGILDEDDESLPRAKPSAKPVDFSDPETRAKLARIEEDWGDD